MREEREILIHVLASSIYRLKFPVLSYWMKNITSISVAGIMKANVMSRLIPEMIVVGIPSKDRYRDLITVHVGDDSNN